MNLGATELLILLGIIIILFGARRIPEIMRGMGEGIRGFKEGISGHSQPPPPPSNQPPADKPGDDKK